MKFAGIIPARFASSRFPGKPLAMIGNKSMVQRVYEQAMACTGLDVVAVATDDERIANHVTNFGGVALLTSPNHPSGTDRCLEAAFLLNGAADAVINIQGDEPFIRPDQISAVIELIRQGASIATLAIPIAPEIAIDPNKVKLVRDQNGKALYFSRSPIPFLREPIEMERSPYLKHLGIYGYRLRTLREIAALPVSPLEQSEKLEQLRWLENGYAIHVSITDFESPAIDTPEDLRSVLNSKDLF
jgi:3-deoxy-manno-octulosonate cytidylyltransferase (CMP-KDO synthetase)